MVTANGSLSIDSVTQSKTNANIQNAFKSSVNGQYVDDSQQSIHTSTAQHTKANHQNTDNDVIRVLINGQPTRFDANTVNLSNKNTKPISHSHSNVNEHEFSRSSHNNDKSPKIGTDKFSSSSNSRDRTSESMQSKQKQQHSPKYSDDAMHLPDIVVGSTLLGANVNSGMRKPIPLSRSPPKIVVNDNTLDSWSSNEDETGTLSDSFDESIEVDEEVSELTDVSVLFAIMCYFNSTNFHGNQSHHNLFIFNFHSPNSI